MMTRGQKLLMLAKKLGDVEEPPNHPIFLPKYDTTKGTMVQEQNVALDYYQDTPSFSEDKTSGSEYLPSTSSASKNPKPNSRKLKLLLNRETSNESQNESSSEIASDEKVEDWLNKNQMLNKNSANIDEKQNIKKQKKSKNRKINIIQNITLKSPNIHSEINLNDTTNENVVSESDTANIKQSDDENIINDNKQSFHSIEDIVPSSVKEVDKLNQLQNCFTNNSESSTVSKIHNKKNSKTGNIFVQNAENKNGRRVRNKVHACYFCMNTFLNMARHFEKIHSNELAVAKVIAKEKNSKERKEGFEEIVRAGDFNHNCEVISMMKGELILVRRPTESEAQHLTYVDYGPCPHCLGFIMKKHLWHHTKQCSQRENRELECQVSKNVVAESNAILNHVFGRQLSDNFIKNIVTKIRDDNIGKCSVNDKLILKYGAMLYEKYDVTQCELIRQSMRQLGRLLLSLREIQHNSTADLTYFLRPDKFDVIVQATKTLCINQVKIQNRPEFEIPSLALKIGYALKKCASLERGKALKEMDLQQDKILTSFLTLVELEWSIRISSNALNTLYSRKLNKTQLLPLTSDLLKLNQLITKDIPLLQEKLKKSWNIENWQSLACYTLARIILFNKRRSGEAARMTMENYNSRPAWSEQTTEETKKSLSPFERKLTEKMIIVEILGKRSKKVPVLLTSETKNSIDILNNLRDQCGVHKDNPYIFALGKNSLFNMRGHDCLSKICKKAELENAAVITGTKLRKYIATVCQLFNLKENEYDWLARHLGHDIKVHREFYRLHESAIELTKVSRLLLAVDVGQADKFAGKTLDEINVDDLPVIEDENEEDVNADEIDETENVLGNDFEKITNQNDIAVHKKTTKISRVDTVYEKKSKSVCPKQPWSEAEKECVLKYFRTHIKLRNVPGKTECVQCIEANSQLLSNRGWKKIKFCIKNQITKSRKLKGIK